MYKIVETFVSIQGEGQNTGVNTLFIRTFGCDMKCPFCDEPKHTDTSLIEYMHIEYIVKMAIDAGVKWVCITGGEPTLNDLRPLIGALQAVELKVQVETNGYNLAMCQNADLITLSPKSTDMPNGRFDEVKIIIPSMQHYLNSKLGDVVYLQPENYEHEVNFDSVKKCLELIEQNPEYRLSVQLHKLLGVE